MLIANPPYNTPDISTLIILKIVGFMPAYSLDLRQKVMFSYHKTKHKSNVCKQFNIARSTLDKWISLEKTIQNMEIVEIKKKGRPTAIKDFESFIKFIEKTPFEKIKDLIIPFEQNFGYKISYTVLWRALKKIDQGS